MVKFFVPTAKDDAQAEELYQAIANRLTEHVFPVRPERFYAIYYTHDGKPLQAVVGETDPLNGETVMAIFRATHETGPFMVCTPNRGVFRDLPILAHGGPETKAVLFDDVPVH